MKFFIYTFGCKTNTYESEAMSRLLSETGRFEEAESYGSADVVIVNSCMVTEESEKKAKKLMRRIRRENPEAVIVLGGCMPQVNREKSLDTGADIILGNTDRSGIVRVIDEYVESRKRIFSVVPHERGEAFEMLSPMGYRSLTRANLKIEDGCECFCAYCVIPFARGPVRSMPVENVYKVAKDLVNAGHREIVLTGINIGMYGRDIGYTIYDAVKAVHEAGAERIRLGSVEIDLISDETVRKLSEVPGLCPHFHTSLQSGSDNVLKRMLRRYDSKEYRRKIELLRECFDNSSITTDVIVGFPGESDEDFRDTVRFVRETGFFRIHVFPYSRREGTAAAKFTDQIPVEVKKARARELEKVAAELKRDFLGTQKGRVLNVLFERNAAGEARGHAENYVEVRVRSDVSLKNRIMPVRILEVHESGEYVTGEIV